LEQLAIVEETVKEDTTRYTATFSLTNSKKVGFTRRDLALCFYPTAVVRKADRNYEALKIDGAILPFDNQRLVRRLWDIIQQKFIYNGTVKKIDRHNFSWNKIARRLMRDYNLKSFRVFPERHVIVTEIQITSNTSNFDEHKEIVTQLYEQMRKNAPHLTMDKDCFSYQRGVCLIDFLDKA